MSNLWNKITIFFNEVREEWRAWAIFLGLIGGSFLAGFFIG